MKVLVLLSLLLAVNGRPADIRVDALKKELLQLNQDLADYITSANIKTMEKVEKVRGDIVQLKNFLESDSTQVKTLVSTDSVEDPCPVGDEICVLMRNALAKGSEIPVLLGAKKSDEEETEDISSISETVAVTDTDTIDVEDEDAAAQVAVIIKNTAKVALQSAGKLHTILKETVADTFQVAEKNVEDLELDELLNQAMDQEVTVSEKSAVDIEVEEVEVEEVEEVEVVEVEEVEVEEVEVEEVLQQPSDQEEVVVVESEEELEVDELLNEAMNQDEVDIEEDVLEELAGVDELVEESETENREQEAADNIIDMLTDTKTEEDIIEMSEADLAALEMEKEMEAMSAMNKLINY